ncbi:tetraspanin-32 isoform X2 [Bos indicus x Bos taurus]|uniref:tetraspanin-32 isoform X2 n=1 Tax=Bos indicus x Bos taurus TaxID=30522 RepID=UPI000F7D2747|nr:tetraspanin-32 isoform X2 [Bos indicus x Bos taurus]
MYQMVLGDDLDHPCELNSGTRRLLAVSPRPTLRSPSPLSISRSTEAGGHRPGPPPTMEDAVLDAYDRAYERALRSASGSGRQELVAIQDTGPQPPSPGAQSLQMHPGGIPVSAPVQSRCSWGPSESKQTLGSASAAPGHPPAYPRERRSYGLDSHVTLVGGEELFPSTWWGSGKRRLDQTSTSIEADGGWGSRGQLQTLGRGWGVRVRAEGIEGGFGRAPWPPTPRLWGEGRTHCRLKQTGGSSVLRSVRTEAPPVSAVHGLLGSGDHFPSSHGPPSSHRRQEGSCSPLTLQAGLSAGPGD